MYPIVFIIALGSGFCAYTVGRRALSHENVAWSKSYKKIGIANQYAHKYPGYASVCGCVRALPCTCARRQAGGSEAAGSGSQCAFPVSTCSSARIYLT